MMNARGQRKCDLSESEVELRNHLDMLIAQDTGMSRDGITTPLPNTDKDYHDGKQGSRGNTSLVLSDGACRRRLTTADLPKLLDTGQDRKKIWTERRETEKRLKARQEDQWTRLGVLVSQEGSLKGEIPSYKESEVKCKKNVTEPENKLRGMKWWSEVSDFDEVFDLTPKIEAVTEVDQYSDVASVMYKEKECKKKLQELEQFEADMKRINELHWVEGPYIGTQQRAHELRQECRHGERNEKLLEKLQNMEENDEIFAKNIRVLETEKNKLVEETIQLREMLQSVHRELENMKEAVAGPFQDKILKEHRLYRKLQEKITTMEKYLRDNSSTLQARINGLEVKMNKASGELREEVETLKTNVSELKILIEQQKQSEDALISDVYRKILEKEQQLEEAKRKMRFSLPPSTREEACGNVLHGMGVVHAVEVRKEAKDVAESPRAGENKIGAAFSDTETADTPQTRAKSNSETSAETETDVSTSINTGEDRISAVTNTRPLSVFFCVQPTTPVIQSEVSVEMKHSNETGATESVARRTGISWAQAGAVGTPDGATGVPKTKAMKDSLVRHFWQCKVFPSEMESTETEELVASDEVKREIAHKETGQEPFLGENATGGEPREETTEKDTVAEMTGVEQVLDEEKSRVLAEGEETAIELPVVKESAPKEVEKIEMTHDARDGTESVTEIDKGVLSGLDKGEPLARTPLVAATIKKIKVSADGEPQGGAGKLLPVVESAPAEVEPPDPVMTPEVVGEFGTGDAMLALELEELRRKNTQIQQEVQNLQERSRQKCVEMLEFKKAVSELQRKVREERTDVICPPQTSGEVEDSSLPKTVPELQNLLVELQKKCRTKDHMIMALANDLRLRAMSGGFEDLLGKLELPESQLPEQPLDFDKEQLSWYLKRLEGNDSRLARPLPDVTIIPSAKPKGREVAVVRQDPQPPEVQRSNDLKQPSATSLRVLRRVGLDCLLLGWNLPPAGYFLGLQIFVNGSLVHTVRSPTRNKALLHSLDFSCPIMVTMLALTPQGRYSKPAYFVFHEPGNGRELGNSKYN